jgi:hypothetical protein
MRGGNGCGPAASPRRGLIIGIGSYDSRGGTVAFVVSERVAAAVLPGGQRLPATSDPRVPAPLKLIIARVPTASEGRARFVDSSGRDLPDQDPKGSWAAERHRFPTRKTDPDGPCRMRVPAPFRVRSTSVISSIPAGRDDVVRPSFLSCATAVVYLGKARLRAAILLGAHAPSNTAPLLPGMASEPVGIVETGRLTSARRAGDGWLTVYGADPKLRERLLRAINEQAP